MTSKKLLCLIMALTLLLCLLSGCGKTDTAEDTGDAEDSTTEDTTDSTADGTTDEADTAETFSYSTGLTDNGFFDGVTASDIVTLPEYTGVSIPADTLVASDESVQEQIDSILSSYSNYEQITDRAIVDGDTLNIDYVGTVDGVEFSGGNTNGAGTDVTIGVTSYIDDFLEQLIGHTPGETFDIEVTFPDPYENNPDLAGKDAVFSVTINYIQGDLIEQEFDDTVAADYGYADAAEFRTAIEDSVIASQKSDFIDSILSSATCEEVPQSVLDCVTNIILCSYNEYAVSYGVDVDTLLSYYGYESRDAFLEGISADINQMAIKYLAVQAIAEKEGLSVSVDDISEAGAESYIDYYGEPYVKFNLLRTMNVTNFIMDNGMAA